MALPAPTPVFPRELQKQLAAERGQSSVSGDATLDELRERAAELEIEGRSSMNKKQLERAIKKAES